MRPRRYAEAHVVIPRPACIGGMRSGLDCTLRHSALCGGDGYQAPAGARSSLGMAARRCESNTELMIVTATRSARQEDGSRRGRTPAQLLRESIDSRQGGICQIDATFFEAAFLAVVRLGEDNPLPRLKEICDD